MGFRLLIERLGRKIDTVRPHDSACLWINQNCREVSGVVQRRQDSCPAFGREVDISHRAIAEQQTEHVITDHGHAYHDRQVVLAHFSMLRQWLDAVQWLVLSGPFPVRKDLILAKLGPLPNELQRPGLKTPGKHFAIYRYA
jgi:hypothetical protein